MSAAVAGPGAGCQAQADGIQLYKCTKGKLASYIRLYAWGGFKITEHRTSRTRGRADQKDVFIHKNEKSSDKINESQIKQDFL